MKYENIVRCQFSTKKVKEMHFHQDIEIIYVLDGRLEVAYEESCHFLNTDDFLLINANVRHEYHSEGDVLLGSVFIDYTMLTEIFSGEQLFFLCDSTEEKSESYDKMRYYIRQIFNYYQTAEGQGILLKNSIYYQLIYLVTTDFIVKKGMSRYDSLRGIHDERLNEILSFIMTNYREQITLKELADRLFLSHTYLSKYIKQNFGMSFLKLVNNIRLEHAVSDLLYTDKTVLKIAMDNGFHNQAGFNHTFRESYQTTPAEYRAQMREKREKPESDENSQKILKRVEQYLTSNLVSAPDAASSAVSILEIDTRERKELKRNWCRMINIGHAKDILRYDIREQIRFLKENLKFEYMRFWNLLSDEMMIEIKSVNARYNFKLVDQVLDFLMEIDVKPHIELGFKCVNFFARVNRETVPMDEENQLDVIGKNQIFLEELIKHLTRRYGIQKVESWYFELEWNPVNQKKVTIEQYLKAFDKIAGIFRAYAPRVKIGGAGFSLNYVDKEFPEMIENWKHHKQRPDFISIYSYPYLLNEELLDAGRNPYSSDESYLYHQVQRAKEILREQEFEVPEFLVTEWSSTLSNRNSLNDGCYKSAYIIKNLIQNYGMVDAVSYWSASDIFSESMDSSKLLFGGCGLLTQDGIRKPAYFAFEHMNHLENWYLGRNQNAIVSCNARGLYFICCHNYKHFNFRYYAVNEDEIEIENQQRLYEDNESMQMIFKLHHVNNGTYQVKIFSVNQDAGNVQSEWGKLDYFNDLSVMEIEYLDRICQPRLSIHKIEAEDHTVVVETRLTAQEIQAIVVAEM